MDTQVAAFTANPTVDRELGIGERLGPAVCTAAPRTKSIAVPDRTYRRADDENRGILIGLGNRSHHRVARETVRQDLS